MIFGEFIHACPIGKTHNPIPFPNSNMQHRQWSMQKWGSATKQYVGKNTSLSASPAGHQWVSLEFYQQFCCVVLRGKECLSQENTNSTLVSTEATGIQLLPFLKNSFPAPFPSFSLSTLKPSPPPFYLVQQSVQDPLSHMRLH